MGKNKSHKKNPNKLRDVYRSTQENNRRKLLASIAIPCLCHVTPGGYCKHGNTAPKIN